MQVDNSIHTQFSTMNPSFEDFFNMEMLAQNSAAGSSSRSSSSSPGGGFSALPPTPPQGMDSFFNFSFDEEFKRDTMPPPPATSPFDFFGLSNNPHYSPASGSGTSPDSVTSPAGVLAIDPQLMDTPSAPKPQSDFDEEELFAAQDGADVTSAEDPALIPPYKVGGKGKSNRKGTVQSGGVVKKTSVPKEKVVSSPQSSVDDSINKDSDDWRPSPEEYKKMSSKEKRQLRNKISARNFRVRRKEYITTLETDIAERDRLIDAIRGELGSTKSENSALRQEIDALKKALLDGSGNPILPPPAPLPAVSAAASVAARQAANPSSPLIAPNTQKDLPSSPRLAGARGGFWGGQGSSPFGTMGGFTPVHTTLIPDWSISGALAGKGLVTPPDSPELSLPRPLQENINPALNKNLGVKQQPSSPTLHPSTPFDSFTDVNPFTMKTLDMYRMHLWTRMAQQQSLQRQMQVQTNSQPPALNGLAAGLRPHYFTTSKSPLAPSNGVSGLLSGKGSATSYPSPPATPSPSESLRATPQEAVLASLASQTLLSKLGSAFWEAFAGQSSQKPLTPSTRRGLDADKIRKVLEGKAVVKVVDIEEPVSSPVLRASVSSPNLKVSPSTSSPRPTSPKVSETKDRCTACVTDILEESMRSLSISKRGSF